MAIKDRNLSVGTKLVAKYKREAYTAEVVHAEEGKLRYRLEDGREFKSPSAAGSAVMGGNACNGWSFWSVEMDPTATEDRRQDGAEEPQEDMQAQEIMDADEEQEETRDGTSVGIEDLAPAKKRIFRVPNQQGMPEGETRHYCHDCGKSFTTSSEESPQVCPKGHPAE